MYPVLEIRRLGTYFLDFLGVLGWALLACHLLRWETNWRVDYSVVQTVLLVSWFVVVMLATLGLMTRVYSMKPGHRDEEKWYRAYDFVDVQRWRLFLFPGQIAWIVVPAYHLADAWWCYLTGMLLFFLVHIPVRGWQRSSALTLAISIGMLTVLPFAGILAVILAYAVFELLMYLVALAMINIERQPSFETDGQKSRRGS